MKKATYVSKEELEALSDKALVLRLANDPARSSYYRKEFHRRESIKPITEVSRGPFAVKFTGTTIKRCAWPGCGRRIRPGHVMCEKHWKGLDSFKRFNDPIERLKDKLVSNSRRNSNATKTPETR